MNGLTNIKEFVDLVDSNNATPGGGSVSALVGSFGCALVRMYGHLSVNKKAFLALDENVQNEFIRRFNELEALKEELFTLIEHDTNAYNDLMETFKLPKNSDEEISIRKEKISECVLKVTDSPLKMMEVAFKALELSEFLLGLGNKNADSDLLVGLMLLEVAIKGAYQNVKINLGGLDQEKRDYYVSKSDELMKKTKVIMDKVTPNL